MPPMGAISAYMPMTGAAFLRHRKHASNAV